MGSHHKSQGDTKARHRRGKCQRCLDNGAADFIVTSDIVHIKVCTRCAEEARHIGLTVKRKPDFKDAA